MAKLIVNALQIGQSSTPANNLYIAPSGLNGGSFTVMRGNVGAGTQELLHIAGDGRFTTSLGLTVGSPGLYVVGPSSLNGQFDLHANMWTSGNIYAEGDITGLSDATTKHDIVTIDSAVEKVKQLHGVTFTRNADGVRSTGLLAQDVQAVLPEAVHTQDDGKLSLAYGNLVGLLVQAIKEQQVQIEQLQSQLSKGV